MGGRNRLLSVRLLSFHNVLSVFVYQLVSSVDRITLLQVICRYYFEDLSDDHHDRPAGRSSYINDYQSLTLSFRCPYL